MKVKNLSEIKYIVPYEFNNALAKNFLRSFCGISSTHWKKIKFSGNFRRNGDLITYPARLIVYAGDVLTWNLNEKSDIVPENIPLNIKYEDDFLLIADKPAGMLVHPTHGEISGTLANAVMGYYEKNNVNIAFHPIHRLDRNTSGLLLIAKAPELHHKLAPRGKKLFERVYYAVIEGKLEKDKGTINLPIGRDETSIVKRTVRKDGLDAVTHYEVIKNFEDFSLVKIILETGRTHQIRVHFAHIGHPLAGDDLYGGKRDKITRQALHSAEISFIHPVTEKFLRITSDLPLDMKNIVL